VSSVRFGKRHRLHRDRVRGSRHCPYARSERAMLLSTPDHMVLCTVGVGTLGGDHTIKLGSATAVLVGSHSGPDCWTAACLCPQPTLASSRNNSAGHCARSGGRRDGSVLRPSLDAGASRLSVSRCSNVRCLEAARHLSDRRLTRRSTRLSRRT
jgi:hypothetical protein